MKLAENIIVIGLQWGDEGKGKIVDFLAEKSDVIVRFQGGHNAGHTLVIDGVVYKLSLLPSGLVRKGKIGIIGSGVVIDPHTLLAEIDKLTAQGLEITANNLIIADNAPLILSIHKKLDMLSEKIKGKDKIGTTGRGIGPAYEDKVARRGIRVCDLVDIEDLKAKVIALVARHNLIFTGLGETAIDSNDIINELIEIREKLLKFAQPVWKKLDEYYTAGKKILFEGAQGAMLDIDYGTYPFVTSSNTIAGQAFVGSGLGIKSNIDVLGIAKAYTTRVGSGVFPSEQKNDVGEELGVKGNEFGTVTGRKRRCGWFDAVLVKQAVKLSGVNKIALTKLDVLDNFAKLKIVTGYKYKEQIYDYFPTSNAIQQDIIPIYEELDGWQQSGNTAGIRDIKDLPPEAIAYIKRIEELVEAKITIVATGAEREDTINIE